MKWKFVPREDQLLRKAGAPPRIGSPARYYGREFDGETRSYPASAEPFEVDSDSDHGLKCAKHCRKGALWPADKATAAAIGAEFVDIEFSEGAWVAKKPKSASLKIEKAAS
jgi:hypothetical protein